MQSEHSGLRFDTSSFVVITIDILFLFFTIAVFLKVCIKKVFAIILISKVSKNREAALSEFFLNNFCNMDHRILLFYFRNLACLFFKNVRFSLKIFFFHTTFS